MTKAAFQAQIRVSVRPRFNAARSWRTKAPEDTSLLDKISGRLYDCWVRRLDRAAAKAEVRAMYFPWWLTVVWWLWGEDLVDWMLSLLWGREGR